MYNGGYKCSLKAKIYFFKKIILEISLTFLSLSKLKLEMGFSLLLAFIYLTSESINY